MCIRLSVRTLSGAPVQFPSHNEAEDLCLASAAACFIKMIILKLLDTLKKKPVSLSESKL